MEQVRQLWAALSCLVDAPVSVCSSREGKHLPAGAAWGHLQVFVSQALVPGVLLCAEATAAALTRAGLVPLVLPH